MKMEEKNVLTAKKKIFAVIVTQSPSIAIIN